MRATVTLRDEIVNDLMALTDARTKTDAINKAVAEYVRRRKIDRLRALRGKVMFEVEPHQLRSADIPEVEGRRGRHRR